MNQQQSKIAWLGLGVMVLASLAACEGGRATAIGAGGARADSLGSGGIKAFVDSAQYHFTGDMRYTAAGLGKRAIKVVSLDSDHSDWSIQALAPEVGNYLCDESGLAVQLQREGMTALTTANGGSCELTVTTANLDRLRGTFQGSLIDADGRKYPLENGAFDIELASAIPDLDEDGLSDADDNCPFAPNPGQADSNADDRGDACDPADDAQ